MTFRRTSKGISNQHLFYGVDYVVFVEGGRENFTKTQAYDGQFDASAVDIKFWQSIFELFLKNNTFQFRAIGSKSTLMSIIADVEAKKIKNVYVAIDRDHNSEDDSMPRCKFVASTYGYSWENDIWQPEIAYEVINTVCVVTDSKQKVLENIASIFNQFDDDFHTAVVADILMHARGGSFIPRQKHLCLLKVGKKIIPRANVQKVRELIEQTGITMSDIENIDKKCKSKTFRDCYGHLVSDFCYWLVVYWANTTNKVTTIAKHFVNMIAIDKFFIRLSPSNYPELYNHYNACLTR